MDSYINHMRTVWSTLCIGMGKSVVNLILMIVIHYVVVMVKAVLKVTLEWTKNVATISEKNPV